MNVESRTFKRFWKYYDQLPEQIRQQADKQYALFVSQTLSSFAAIEACGPVLVGADFPFLPRSRSAAG